MLYGTKRALLFGDKIRWIINDSFNDTLAAGAVNGTPATPGPGIRTVRDTGGDEVSIGGGVAQLANPTGWVDPALWISSVTRTPGLVGLFSATFPATNGHIKIGLSENAPVGNATANIMYFTATATITVPPAITISSYTATSYMIGIVLRTVGTYYFIKGGVYTNWSLLWFDGINASATLYPALVDHSAVPAIDFIRVPQSLWIPPPLAYDTFTRADGLIGSTEIVGPDAQTTPIRAWTGATWSIDTNQVKNTPSLGAEEAGGNLTVDNWYQITATQVNHFFAGCAIWDCFRASAATALDANNKVQQITLVDMFATFETGTPSILMSNTVTLDAGVQAAGVITNLDDPAAPANFLVAYHNGTNARLSKCVAGAYTSIINNAAAYAAGQVLRIHTRRDGANLKVRLYYNENFIGAEETIADAGIVDNTIHGQMSTNPPNRLDNFQLFAQGKEDSYNILDRWTR